MTGAIVHSYDRVVSGLSGLIPEGLALLFVRIALAGVFWRSGRSKVIEGSWLEISDTTYELFRTEYSGVPFPPEFAAAAATGAEHLLPVLMVIGLFTRLSSLALLGMTLIIQFFVYPDAWWPVHALWAALALVLIVRGGGLISLDNPLGKRARP